MLQSQQRFVVSESFLLSVETFFGIFRLGEPLEAYLMEPLALIARTSENGRGAEPLAVLCFLEQCTLGGEFGAGIDGGRRGGKSSSLAAIFWSSLFCGRSASWVLPFVLSAASLNGASLTVGWFTWRINEEEGGLVAIVGGAESRLLFS